MSIADYARTLTVQQLEREVSAARANDAGDDYIADLERVLDEKRQACTGCGHAIEALANAAEKGDGRG